MQACVRHLHRNMVLDTLSSSLHVVAGTKVFQSLAMLLLVAGPSANFNPSCPDFGSPVRSPTAALSQQPVLKKRNRFGNQIIASASLEDPGSASDMLAQMAAASPSLTDEPSAETLERSNARTMLLQRASGLDRGIVANGEDVRAIDDAARDLEACSSLNMVNWTDTESVYKLDGQWRLVYSSAFATGTLGGERPGPASNGPVRFGKVFQRINTREQRLDNIIAPVYLDAPWPLPPPPSANIELGHALEFLSENEIRITSDGANIRPIGASPLSFDTSTLPTLPTLPFADELRTLLPEEVKKSLQRAGSSTFSVSYLDDVIYLTRGDRGELRVFVRDDGSLF